MIPKRSHLLLAGLLLFLVGVQFRMVESFTLSEKSSKLLVAQLGDKGFPQQQSLFGGGTPAGRRTVDPPAWLGLALMSVGSVITLKSLSMKD
ncbi:MAG: hypothetical protein WCJ31_08645 [Planctomycetia bacterium]